MRRLSQDEFGQIAFDVMRHAFDIHRQLGRFFDEEVYQIELSRRCANAHAKLPVKVTFEGFEKVYFMDLLVNEGALFELKAGEALHDRHRSQLLNYLLLTDLAHGKLINFRPESVQHEFVNTTLRRSDRTSFRIDDADWEAGGSTTPDLKPYLVALLRDIGTGLDVELYEEALIHCLGGADTAIRSINVKVDGRRIGKHKMVCTSNGIGIRLSTLKRHDLRAFEDHHRRFLNHTDLSAMHWINITRSAIAFRTLQRDRGIEG